MINELFGEDSNLNESEAIDAILTEIRNCKEYNWMSQRAEGVE